MRGLPGLLVWTVVDITQYRRHKMEMHRQKVNSSEKRKFLKRRSKDTSVPSE
jgi:hypothetical protein